jgi:WD40 repeat protein
MAHAFCRNFNSGVCMNEYPRLAREVTSIAFVEQGKWIHRPLVSAGWDAKMMLLADGGDEKAQVEPLSLLGHKADILCVCIADRMNVQVSPSILVCSGDADGSVMLSIASSGRLECILTSSQLSEGCDGLDKDALRQRKFATLMAEDAESGASSQNEHAVFSMLHLPMYDVLLVGVSSGYVHVIDLAQKQKMVSVPPELFPDDVMPENVTADTPACILSLNVYPDSPSCMAVNPAGTRIFLGESSGALQMWNVKRSGKRPTFVRVRRFQGHWRSVVSIVCSHKSRLFVSCGSDGSGRVWTPKGRPLHYFGSGVSVASWPKWIDHTYIPDVAEMLDKSQQRSFLSRNNRSASRLQLTSPTLGSPETLPGADPQDPDSSPRQTQPRQGRSQQDDATAQDVDEGPKSQVSSPLSKGNEQQYLSAAYQESAPPFHIVCPPFIPKTLATATNKSSKALQQAMKSMGFADTPRTDDDDRQDDAHTVARKQLPLYSALEHMHKAACMHTSAEDKQHLASLNARLHAVLEGPPVFPSTVNLTDLLPQASTHDEMCQRVEQHYQLIETLTRHRILIKDVFRTYASHSLSQVRPLPRLQALDDCMRFFIGERGTCELQK